MCRDGRRVYVCTNMCREYKANKKNMRLEKQMEKKNMCVYIHIYLQLRKKSVNRERNHRDVLFPRDNDTGRILDRKVSPKNLRGQVGRLAWVSGSVFTALPYV